MSRHVLALAACLVAVAAVPGTILAYLIWHLR